MDNGNLTQQPDISVEIGNLEKLLEKITVYAKDKNLDEFALPNILIQFGINILNTSLNLLFRNAIHQKKIANRFQLKII